MGDADMEEVKTETPKPAPSPKQKRKGNKKGSKGQVGGEIGGFTVLGDPNLSQNQHVKRVLPYWLANPSIISCNLKDSKVPITSLSLDPELVSRLEANFIPYFFPVQYQVIPSLIRAHSPKLFRPSDLCISAPTGSGKTLSYVLPVIQILKNSSLVPCVRAIVVLPTEVLATQVYSVFQTYGKGTGLRVFLMSRRLTFTSEKDALICKSATGKLSTPHDIIIATPGRLIDHLEKTKGFDISRLQFLIVDEADRTLDDQEGDWLNRLEAKFWSCHPIDGVPNPWKSIPLTVRWTSVHLKAFQKLLFSATLSQNPETLEKLHLFQPKLLTSIVEGGKKDSNGVEDKKNVPEVSDSFVGKFTTPLELKESFVLCHKDMKPLILSYLISHFNWKRVLCFTNTKESTHRLCLLLKYMGNLNVKEISAKWTAKARDVMLKKFASGAIDILVTSDQMARGIDIPTVDYVISYDLPGYTKTYIHRIGRCARAGRDGHAVSLVMKEQIGMYKKTMKSAGKNNFERLMVKNSDLKELEPKFKEALTQLKTTVTEEEDTLKSHKGRKQLEVKKRKDKQDKRTAKKVNEKATLKKK
ncbi:ATP-dependent RNA helicase DDX51 [Orchesella cincta]|uniref:ATP-dependent RNA helicase n=1 Tax=Orchesella cincta TaxID=48709 RepID=A0A1D2NIM7_ORCCI|nr:ATP-dependent RNA helicase DDX51 [Orchesella cincta]